MGSGRLSEVIVYRGLSVLKVRIYVEKNVRILTCK